jgi:deoxyribonuclease-4
VAFVEAMLTTDPDMLRLIHFNDSMDTCGACKDRHAFVGTGKIGVSVLEAVAKIAEERGIPMVLE